MLNDKELALRRFVNQATIVGDLTFLELYNRKGECVAEVIIDTEDLEKVAEKKWHLNGHGRVYTNDKARGYLDLSYFILNLIPEYGMEIDHKDRDTLNYRKSNLRFCTHADNSRNQGKRSDNTSGFKGVSWRKANGKWVSQISFNNERYHLGYFDDPIEAAIVYDIAAKKYHGEFAVTNF